MAPRNAERSEATKVLRGLAAQYDVDRVPDNASLARVTNMNAALLQAEGLTAEHRQEAEQAWSVYLATWPAPGRALRTDSSVAAHSPTAALYVSCAAWNFHSLSFCPGVA